MASSSSSSATAATTLACMICQTQNERVVCANCNREMNTRETIHMFEQNLRQNENDIRAAEAQLRLAQDRKRELMHNLTTARNACANLEMARASRTRVQQERVLNFTTPTRGREREEEEDVTLVAGPAGSACPPGWQSRRTRPRPPPPAEVEGPQCNICLQVPSLPEKATARCHTTKCSFETCYVCWEHQKAVNGNCPQCRARILDLDSDADSDA